MGAAVIDTTLAELPSPTVIGTAGTGPPVGASVAVVPSTTTTGGAWTVVPSITVTEGVSVGMDTVWSEMVVSVPGRRVSPLGRITAGGLTGCVPGAPPAVVGAGAGTGVRSIGRGAPGPWPGFGLLGLLLPGSPAVVGAGCGLFGLGLGFGFEPVVAGGGCSGSLGFVLPGGGFVSVSSAGGGFTDVSTVGSGGLVVVGSFVVMGSAGTLVVVEVGGAGPAPSILIVVVAWLVSAVTGMCTLGSPDPLGTEHDLSPGISSVKVGVSLIQ